MVGYFEILQSLDDAKDLDLRGSRKADLSLKLRKNPLGLFFLSLKDFLRTNSAEAIEMRHKKTRSRTPSPTKKAKLFERDELDQDILLDAIPHAPLVLPSSSISTTPNSKKRDFSGGSYGSSSTETSPARINHGEPRTQALQNNLIQSLIHHIWSGVKVSWAQNREMYLDYQPYILYKRDLILVTFTRRFVAVSRETTAMPRIVSSLTLMGRSFFQQTRSLILISRSFGACRRQLLCLR
jgi:hypothetical protein